MNTALIQLRDYQRSISQRASEIIYEHGFVYLAMEVRTGKTLTSIATCENVAKKFGRKFSVLFVTKKKAISSISSDVAAYGSEWVDVRFINYESLHTINAKCDILILDEAHSLGAFPKPSQRAKIVASIVAKNKCYVILMSGTPTPESYSQMYHQVYGMPSSPFIKFKTFYQFANSYVEVRTKKINGFDIRDYSRGSQEIVRIMSPYTISFSQSEAGFNSKITEHIKYVPPKSMVIDIIRELKNNKVVYIGDEVILADTGVKMMSKIHQLCGGTVISESGKAILISDHKVQFIFDEFQGKKMGIFYKFKAEYEMIKSVMGDMVTDNLDEFNQTNKHIALQIVSGREGISLKNADVLVYYNIDFSATSYWQSRDRMTTSTSLESDVYWIFTEGGIESNVYGVVSNKKDFTIRHFNRVTLFSND